MGPHTEVGAAERDREPGQEREGGRDDLQMATLRLSSVRFGSTQFGRQFAIDIAIDIAIVIVIAIDIQIDIGLGSSLAINTPN